MTCDMCGAEINPGDIVALSAFGYLCEICNDKAAQCAPEEEK